MNTDQPQPSHPSQPVASMQRSEIEEPAPLTLEQRVENLERQVASIVRAGAANIMAARGADKAPGAALPPPEKPVDPLAGIPDAATAPEVRYVVCAAIAATADYVCTSKESVIARHIAIAPRHGDSSIHAELTRWQESIPDKISEITHTQGFIDQYGVFMTRTEAWQVALAAGQIRYRCGGDTANGGTLYSENLY